MRAFPRWGLGLIAAVFLASASVSAAPVPAPAVVASPDSAPPRLDKLVMPTEQEVSLTLDPEQADYRGNVRIAIAVKQSVREFRLHARALTIDRVMLTSPSGAVAIQKVERLVPDQVRLTFAEPLAPASYKLEIDFHNLYNTKAISLYRVVTGGRGYLFTQLEDTEAREAFPCFDEPEFKIPWTMRMTVPTTDLAVSNTPIERAVTLAAERVKPGGAPAKSMKRVEFKRSPPMPSYLVAIIVGPFETVPIPGLGVPGRVVTVKGASGLAGEAVKATPAIMRSLERYFGRPYPYEKLDLIAAPEFLFGAMENAGAIVFADRRLLVDPRSVSPDQRATLTAIMAHEIAHMWFGDLVTMRWWDDLWLNESFASWMATKAMDDVYPENHHSVTRLFSTERAKLIDSRLSTRAMRAPVVGAMSLGQTASALTYNKGESVLTMFEGWLGRENFRLGVVDYINTHAWGNADASDLWRALGKVSGADIDGAMATFLEQPGIPLVTIEPLAGGKVKLSQQRFVSVGEVPAENPRWTIPVILRYPATDSIRTLRVWMTGADTTVSLGVDATPAWIEPNANASAYFRWAVPEPMLESLVASSRASLMPRERIDLILNLTAQLRAGTLQGDRYLAWMAPLSDDPAPEVVRAAVDVLSDTRVALTTPRADSAYAHFLRATLEPAVRRFGMRPSAGEPIGVSFMRPPLLRLLAQGHDSRVIAYAETLSRDYRRDAASVPPSMVETGIVVGAVRGDRAQFDDYRTRFETTKVPIERTLYLNGLAAFRDPALRRAALDYALNGPLRPQETLVIPGGTALNSLGGEGRTSDMYPDEIVQWTFDHFDELREKLPPNFAARIVGLGSGCSNERLATLQKFFSDPKHKVLGGEATLKRMEDALRECAGVHDRESERVERWLMMQSGRP